MIEAAAGDDGDDDREGLVEAGVIGCLAWTG